MPYTARDFFDPFKDVFRACIMLPIERVEKGWSCQVIYCFNNQWDERVGFMQSLAWISNLSESNKLPLENSRLFFIFENVLTRLFCSFNRTKRGSEKLFPNFPTQCVLSRDLTARISVYAFILLIPPENFPYISPMIFCLLPSIELCVSMETQMSHNMRRFFFQLRATNWIFADAIKLFVCVPAAMWHFFILIFA